VPEIALETRHLGKSFGGVDATRDVTLAVERGSIHALVGPNGAGKTTLLHQLAGTVTPDRGAVLLEGEDITRLGAAARVRRGIARTFQITALCNQLTALEHVLLAVQRKRGLSFKLWSRALAPGDEVERALACLDRVGLRERAGQVPDELSYGEQRQLELAIALGCEPSLLLLDEPLAGVGHAEARMLIELVRTFRGSFTTILIEHDMEAVFALADTVSVLHEGSLIASGNPDAIAADAAVREAYLGDDSDA
jgi:branched-chain amino acid transport system ATP-binding protein